MVGPRQASANSNVGNKPKSAPKRSAPKPAGQMPTRSVGKPVGTRVSRSPTKRSKPAALKAGRIMDSRGNISSAPTRKVRSASEEQNRRNAAMAKLRNDLRTPPARPTRPPSRPAASRPTQPTTSSRRSPAPRPTASRRRSPMSSRISALMRRRRR
jgi:septal ring-binding cell division protein DamX